MDAIRYSRSTLAAALLAAAAATSLDAQARTLANPRGPAPQNVHVMPGSPLRHALAWDRLSGVAGYLVFKTIKGLLYPLTQNVILTETWTDFAVVAPGTVYRVRAVYADGRLGDTDFTYTTPPQPQAPTGFTVQQVGPGTVTLSWQSVPYAAWYKVFGTGQPTDGTIVTATSTTFTKLADGAYTWQVSADYDGSWGPGPSASLTITSTGRYRVVANGFRVVGQTPDLTSPFMVDGQNDEVYAGFAMFHVGRPAGQLLDQDLRATQTHGDVHRFPSRAQAGTASLSGGLRNGDVFPVVADPSRRSGQTLSNQTFPFLIWDGFLTDAQDAVIILPTIWESDAGFNMNAVLGSNMNTAQVYTNWFLSEKSLLAQIWSDVTVQQALNGKSISLITTPAWTYFPFQFGRMDHPLGSNFDLPQGSVAGGEQGRSLPRRAIVLTREMIEAALNGGASGIVSIPLGDSGPQPSPLAFGSYILYVQVERVP